MLLRLAVKGFKNLRDVEVRFGTLTCFAGLNGVGKSNVFDAIQFLRRLADEEIQRAAEAVRSPASGTFGPLDLFWGADQKGNIELEVDMIVPPTVVDDFGRPAKPSITILRYSIAFRYADAPRPRLELLREDLSPIQIGHSKAAIGFPHEEAFRKSVVMGKRRGAPFISTDLSDDNHAVILHQDGGSRGRGVPPGQSPRTVLGGTGSAEHPTVLAARREMASWVYLHLEPSALRAPDPFGSKDSVSEHGAHVAATLDRLGRTTGDPAKVFAEAANRLARLVPEIAEIRVRADEVNRQFVLEARESGSSHWLGARALSDGTLRFLSLITMQMDPQASRVLCMEEPENGIHPSRIPAMMDLLRDYAVEPSMAVGDDNPARQVVINTHSPEILRQLSIPDVLFVGSGASEAGRWATISAVDASGNWRREMGTVPLSQFSDLLGGSPLSLDLDRRQLRLHFGTAS